MKVLKLFVILLLPLVLLACDSKKQNNYLAIAEATNISVVNNNQEHPGKQLMEDNCYMCHNPHTAKENLIAPPMVAIKKHYISSETTKEEFVEAMVVWAKNPSEEKSKMPMAIKKFGLKPYQFYPERSIRQIADYMFTHKIEEPRWFKQHYKKMLQNDSIKKQN
tara:strand:- start:153436 stop:153927 length:492 start_codon:yes stop_codon:yes gene_type:complete